MIPYGRQDINEQDLDAVIAVLKSDFLTQGPQVPFFEKTVVDYCGASYGVAVNSATSALHLACLALGLGKDDILWTSPNTFVASANCAIYCGASIDFVDIDSKTYNLCADKLEKKLIQAKSNNKLPKIIIPVHFAGQSCDMQRIHRLSKEYGFKIIEDASHAIGGKYLDEPIGSCRFSDITVFSFHPVKIITTAEGGLATTNCAKLSEKMTLLRSHGVTRDPKLMTHEPHGDWYYQQLDLGFNYRMNDIQAALGVSQMNRLDSFVERRNQLADRYDYLLDGMPLIIPWQHPSNYSGRHLYPVRLKLETIKKTHREVFEYLRMKGIGVNLHYIPVHTQPYYRQLGFRLGDYPEVERYYSEVLSLPLYSSLSESDQDRVVAVLEEALLQ